MPQRPVMPTDLPEGAPPTLEQHRTIVEARGRNHDDDPISLRVTQRGYVPGDCDPDILRRLNEPVPGERTPEQAARIRARKAAKRQEVGK